MQKRRFQLRSISRPEQSISGADGVMVNRIGGSYTVERTVPYPITPPGSSSKGSEEIVISKVVRCNDPFDAQETVTCTSLNGLDHLRCYGLDISGNAVVVEPYLPVFPNWPHTISEFSPVNWNPLDPNQPVFQVFSGSDRGGWVMSFGQGEKWVGPPTNICTTPPPTGFGACCQDDGTCNDTNTGDCPAGIGEWKGEGTSCNDIPNPCAQCIGVGCDDLGACCCDLGTACYNDQVPAPSCAANVTASQCFAGGGVWQGANSICLSGTCGAPISGACCMPNNTCQPEPDDVACGLAGGTFFAGDTCGTGVENFGACCFGEKCLMANRLCCEFMSGAWVGGLCSGNPC